MSDHVKFEDLRVGQIVMLGDHFCEETGAVVDYMLITALDPWPRNSNVTELRTRKEVKHYVEGLNLTFEEDGGDIDLAAYLGESDDENLESIIVTVNANKITQILEPAHTVFVQLAQYFETHRKDLLRIVYATDFEYDFEPNRIALAGLFKEDDTRKAVKKATRSSEEDLAIEAAEIIEWKSTGLLNGGKGGLLRKRAQKIRKAMGNIISMGDALTMAENAVNAEARKYLIQKVTGKDYASLLDGVRQVAHDEDEDD